eukprot:scaffold243462_cov18-Tisochrysis_lutea.AAC.1
MDVPLCWKELARVANLTSRWRGCASSSPLEEPPEAGAAMYYPFPLLSFKKKKSHQPKGRVH